MAESENKDRKFRFEDYGDIRSEEEALLAKEAALAGLYEAFPVGSNVMVFVEEMESNHNDGWGRCLKRHFEKNPYPSYFCRYRHPLPSNPHTMAVAWRSSAFFDPETGEIKSFRLRVTPEIR